MDNLLQPILELIGASLAHNSTITEPWTFIIIRKGQITTAPDDGIQGGDFILFNLVRPHPAAQLSADEMTNLSRNVRAAQARGLLP